MAKHGKRYNEIRGKIDRQQYYTPEEAIDLVRQNANAKFDESIEVHLNTGVDPRYADQQVRGVVTLPNGTGRTVRILVFAGPDGAPLATEAGADFVGGDDLAAQIQGGWTDFDVVLATPDMMRVVGRLGRVEFRVDKTSNIHAPIGKASFGAEKLMGNLSAFMEAIAAARPTGLKGIYIKRVTLASTMGPGIKVDTNTALNLRYDG